MVDGGGGDRGGEGGTKGRGAMFSAMWLQETEEVGEESRLGTGEKAGKRDLKHMVSY